MGEEREREASYEAKENRQPAFVIRENIDGTKSRIMIPLFQ